MGVAILTTPPNAGYTETWEWPEGRKVKNISASVLGQSDELVVLLDLAYILLMIHTLGVENKPLPSMETR